MSEQWGQITVYDPSMAAQVAQMFNDFDELWPGGFTGGIPYDEQRVHDWLDDTSAVADLAEYERRERAIRCLLDECGERTGEDVTFVLEVLVQGRARHARLLCDVRHGRAREPAGRKHVDRGRCDQRALWVIRQGLEFCGHAGSLTYWNNSVSIRH